MYSLIKVIGLLVNEDYFAVIKSNEFRCHRLRVSWLLQCRVELCGQIKQIVYKRIYKRFSRACSMVGKSNVNPLSSKALGITRWPFNT